MDPLYEGESIDQGLDGGSPGNELINGRTLMAGIHTINRKYLVLEPQKLTLEPGVMSTAMVINVTDSKLVFKIILPVYPFLTVSPLNGFILPRKQFGLQITHTSLAQQEHYDNGSLPTVKIVACEVPLTMKTDVFPEEFFITMNCSTPLTLWADLKLEMIMDPAKIVLKSSEQFAGNDCSKVPEKSGGTDNNTAVAPTMAKSEN